LKGQPAYWYSSSLVTAMEDHNLVLEYWRNTWRERPAVKLFAWYRPIPSIVAGVITFALDRAGHRWQEFAAATAVVLAIAITFYVAEVLANGCVRSPALRSEADRKVIGQLETQIRHLQEALAPRVTLSEKQTEILAAAYDGLPMFCDVHKFGRTLTGSRSVMAGHIRFNAPDPVEGAEYDEAVDLLLTHAWLKRPDILSPDFYEPTAKGLAKGKEVCDSPEGKAMLEALRKRFPPG
jgi:hypothetical protein